MSTLRLIADHAGVSVATASMAIRDHHSISIETKKKVWEAQAKLGYRSPARRKPSTTLNDGAEILEIAFLLIDRRLDDAGGYGRLFHNAAAEATSKNFRLSLVTSSLKDIQRGQIPEILQDKKVRGLIVSGPCDVEAHRHLAKLDLPMVKDGNFQSDDDPWMTCEPDFASGMKLLVKRVAEYGHTSLGLMVRDTTSEYSQHTQEYFQRELTTHGLQSAGVFCNSINAKEIKRGFQDLLKNGASAVLLGSASFAPAIFEECAESKISVPDEVSVASIGSAGIICHPSIAHVAAEDRSEALVVKLGNLIKNPRQVLTRELFPMRFCSGGSLGPLKSP